LSQKIGEGLQYKVYREGDRVRKEPKERDEMISMASQWYESRQKAIGNVEMALERREKVLNSLNSLKLPEYLLGNPEIGENGVIYQDRLEPLDQRLEACDNLDQKKSIIDDYIDLIHTLWSYGIGDTVYNFTLNNGYDEKDRLVQLDFGEIVFEKQKIIEAIEENRWEDQRSLEKDLSGKIKSYCSKRMRKELTKNKLEELWSSKK